LKGTDNWKEKEKEVKKKDNTIKGKRESKKRKGKRKKKERVKKGSSFIVRQIKENMRTHQLKRHGLKKKMCI